MLIRKFLQNKIFVYLFTRYGILSLSFLTSLMIAGKLGSYYFGIYGFIMLLLNYFGQIHLGIPNSLNVHIVHNKNDNQLCDNYIANSLFIYLYFAIIIALLYIIYSIFGFKPIEKYHIDSYLPAVCIIAILEYINGVLLCVLRVKNKINMMSLVTSIKAVLNLSFVFLFEKETLILALVACLIISNLFTIAICYFRDIFPRTENVHISRKIQGNILNKGIYLFFYNTCFYFIIISIRTLVSSNYSIEEFGLFTFAYTMVSAVMLLLDSLYSILFPKLVDLLSSNDLNKINHTLDVLRVSYISTAHFLIYCSLIVFPLMTNYILPEYSNSLRAMNLTSLAVLMNANSCGYSTLLIAQNREKYSAVISITSLIINIILGVILTRILHVDFSCVIIATLATYLYFSLSIVITGKKVIKQYNWRDTLSQFFPIRLLIPYCLAFLMSFLNLQILCALPLFAYLLLNINDVKKMIDYFKIVLNNENISDIKVK